MFHRVSLNPAHFNGSSGCRNCPASCSHTFPVMTAFILTARIINTLVEDAAQPLDMRYNVCFFSLDYYYSTLDLDSLPGNSGTGFELRIVIPTDVLKHDPRRFFIPFLCFLFWMKDILYEGYFRHNYFCKSS